MDLKRTGGISSECCSLVFAGCQAIAFGFLVGLWTFLVVGQPLSFSLSASRHAVAYESVLYVLQHTQDFACSGKSQSSRQGWRPLVVSCGLLILGREVEEAGEAEALSFSEVLFLEA